MIALQENPKPVTEIRSPFPQRLVLKDGLPPLKQACEFTLSAEDDAPPFLRIESVNLNLSYIVVDPFLLLPDYAPEFSDADCDEIGLSSADKPLVLSIVNFSQGAENATVNLIGPLLVHPQTGKAKQAVLMNAGSYSARHKLLQ